MKKFLTLSSILYIVAIDHESGMPFKVKTKPFWCGEWSLPGWTALQRLLVDCDLDNLKSRDGFGEGLFSLCSCVSGTSGWVLSPSPCSLYVPSKHLLWRSRRCARTQSGHSEGLSHPLCGSLSCSNAGGFCGSTQQHLWGQPGVSHKIALTGLSGWGMSAKILIHWKELIPAVLKDRVARLGEACCLHGLFSRGTSGTSCF